VGMANSVQASRVEEATNLYAISDTCTIAIRESLLCDELDGLAACVRLDAPAVVLIFQALYVPSRRKSPYVSYSGVADLRIGAVGQPGV
jgi:hypothetical protein